MAATLERELGVKADLVEGSLGEFTVSVGDKVVANPAALLSEDSEMKPGKLRSKMDDEGRDPGGDGKTGAKKTKKKGNGNGPEGLNTPGTSPLPGAKGNVSLSDEQKQAWAQKMQSGTPEQRRDIINSLPEAARIQARQKLREQGLEVAD